MFTGEKLCIFVAFAVYFALSLNLFFRDPNRFWKMIEGE